MNFSDHLPALIYLKNKVHKWKNIAILLSIFVAFLLAKILFGFGLEGGVIETDHIASIRIDGVIVEDSFRDKILTKLLEQDSTKAVIVCINSPGGGIVGSEILFSKLYKIAQKKPLVVVMESLAASGGYMAAIASDYIIAHNGTLTGSIGVLMESPEFTELAAKIGVKFNAYKSSPLKGSPSPYEKEIPEVRSAIIKSINDSYDFFVDLVVKRRGEKIKKENWNLVFDGRVFNGRQAAALGLVDKVGGYDDAISYLGSKQIDIKKIPVKEVVLIQEQNDMLSKFINSVSFLKGADSSLRGSSKIMAILR